MVTYLKKHFLSTIWKYKIRITPYNLTAMKRSKTLLDKRKTFIHNYVEDNSAKQMKVIINELVNKLFISEKTIYNILKQ